ncbi:hypothetical protein EDB83DRAFT_2363597 [Lactarius deliciosus]|nr:hypothetical protein EDB83DRAFT_2363597 [Lactarius deliciosus]
MENPHIPATSPDLVAARVIQGGVDTTTMMPTSTPGTLASTPPTSKEAASAVYIRYTAERRTSSDDPDFPSSPPTPILDASHSPIPAPAAPGPSHLRLSSAPDFGVVTEVGGSTEAALNKEKDAIYPPSVILENTTMSTPELPSPQSVNDVAIAGTSRRSLNAEHTGDPPHPSYGQCDIV